LPRAFVQTVTTYIMSCTWKRELWTRRCFHQYGGNFRFNPISSIRSVSSRTYRYHMFGI